MKATLLLCGSEEDEMKVVMSREWLAGNAMGLRLL